MSIRETLNAKRGLGVGVGIALLIVAVIVILRSSGGPDYSVSRMYYSNDDGATYFADDADRIYPFDHEGKSAYRAYVYRCGDDAPFVAYLARYNEQTKAKLDQLIAKNDPADAGEIAQLRSSGIEIKKPGEGEWVGVDTPAAAKVNGVPDCPAGKTVASVIP